MADRDLKQKILDEIDTLIASMNGAHAAKSKEWKESCFAAADQSLVDIKNLLELTSPQPAPHAMQDLHAEATRMQWLLRQIVSALPEKRDWLDPVLEKEAKHFGGAVLAQPAAVEPAKAVALCDVHDAFEKWHKSEFENLDYSRDATGAYNDPLTQDDFLRYEHGFNLAKAAPSPAVAEPDRKAIHDRATHTASSKAAKGDQKP